MPLINIEYDDKSLTEVEAESLSIAVRDIVSKVTEIKDVFVYTNTAKIKVQIAPVEIFIRLSSKINEERTELIKSIKDELSEWKKDENFSHPINLTLIPMDWQIEISI